MDTEKVLIISPSAGMSNKFRALCSAIVLGNYLKRKVYYCWLSEEHENIQHVKEIQELKLTDLFDEQYLIPEYKGESPIDLVYTEWLENSYWYNKQSIAQRKYAGNITKIQIGNNVEEIKKCDANVILIETSLTLYLDEYKDLLEVMMSDVYNRNFKANIKFASLITNFNKDYISVAIRRGDLLAYFIEARQSYEDILQWLKKFDKNKLIIFSNDFPFRNRLRKELGITNNIDFLYEGLNDSEKGFLEFLFISSCSKVVYGTPCSSFYEQAAIHGGKSHHTILS